MKDLHIKKLYYSISEVGRLVGEEHYVLRYWETEFEQLKPQKNRAGNRIYTLKDIAVIKAIKKLLRERRYTIDGAKSIMKTFDPESGEITGLQENTEAPVEHHADSDDGVASPPIVPALSRKDLLELRNTLRSVLALLSGD